MIESIKLASDELKDREIEEMKEQMKLMEVKFTRMKELKKNYRLLTLLLLLLNSHHLKKFLFV